MQKWIMPIVMVLALGCARTTAQARPQSAQPEPAPEPPAAAQDDRAEQGRAAAADEKRAAEKAYVKARAAVELTQAQAEGRGLGRIYAGAKVKKEKVAWLGVVTSPVSGALRKNAKLTHKGVGLVVERVEPGSPAADAGLEQYDIVEKLNDQWLINPQQFGVLIRMNKAGDEVTLSVIRDGQPTPLKAKLVEKEMVVTDEEGMIPGGLGWAVGAGENGGGGVFQLAPAGQLADVTVALPRFEAVNMLDLDALGDNATLSISDDEHTLKVTSKDGNKTLVATDKAGNVLYDGPINNDDDLGNVPDDVRQKLNKIRSMPHVLRIKADSEPTTAPSGSGK